MLWEGRPFPSFATDTPRANGSSPTAPGGTTGLPALQAAAPDPLKGQTRPSWACAQPALGALSAAVPQAHLSPGCLCVALLAQTSAPCQLRGDAHRLHRRPVIPARALARVHAVVSDLPGQPWKPRTRLTTTHAQCLSSWQTHAVRGPRVTSFLPKHQQTLCPPDTGKCHHPGQPPRAMLEPPTDGPRATSSLGLCSRVWVTHKGATSPCQDGSALRHLMPVCMALGHSGCWLAGASNRSPLSGGSCEQVNSQRTLGG